MLSVVPKKLKSMIIICSKCPAQNGKILDIDFQQQGQLYIICLILYQAQEQLEQFISK